MKQAHLLAILFLMIAFSCKEKTTDEKDKKVVINSAENAYSKTAALDSLIELNPDNSNLYYQRSRYYYDRKLFPKALIDILYATQLDSKNIAAYLLAGDIYIAMGQGQDAIDIMNEAINNNQGNEILYERAVEYNFYMKNIQSAMNFANDLLKINKNNANAYFFKGLIHKENNIDKAISNFQTAVEQDPTYYNAYMQLATLFSKKNDKMAIQYYDNALRLQAKSREAIYGKGYFYQQQKQFNKAKSEYQILIIENRGDYQAIFNMAHCFLAQDSLKKAESHFNMAVSAKPDYVDAIYMQGQIAERLGDIVSAKILYQNALKMLPGNETILQSLKEIKAKEQ